MPQWKLSANSELGRQDRCPVKRARRAKLQPLNVVVVFCGEGILVREWACHYIVVSPVAKVWRKGATPGKIISRASLSCADLRTALELQCPVPRLAVLRQNNNGSHDYERLLPFCQACFSRDCVVKGGARLEVATLICQGSPGLACLSGSSAHGLQLNSNLVILGTPLFPAHQQRTLLTSQSESRLFTA